MSDHHDMRTAATLLLLSFIACENERDPSPTLAQYGEKCRLDAAAGTSENCDENLVCLTAPDLVYGYCAETCSRDIECSDEGNSTKAFCDASDGICRFSCEPAKTPCPGFSDFGLSCAVSEGLCYR